MAVIPRKTIRTISTWFEYNFDTVFNKNRMRSIIFDVFGKMETSETLEAVSFEHVASEHILFRSGKYTVFQLGWSNSSPKNMTISSYCAIFSNPNKLFEDCATFGYHQHEQPLSKDIWVWLPRIASNGPTSYEVKYLKSQKAFRWRESIVGRKQSSFSDNKSREELIDELAGRIESDCAKFGSILNNKLNM